MSKIIILEGPDGAGKTTFAGWLTKYHGYRYVHSNKPEPGENVFRTYTKILADSIACGEKVVIDRLFLGERIYGPSMRGHDSLGEIAYELLQRVCLANDVSQVICLPPIGVCVQAWQQKTDDYVKAAEKLTSIYLEYEGYLSREPSRYIRYNWTNNLASMDVVKNLLTSKRSLPYGVTGSPSADILIVGERNNPRLCNVEFPFHDTSGSSLYLYQAIVTATSGDDEFHRRFAYMNAVNLAGESRNLEATLRGYLKPKKIFALGQVAWESCDAHDSLVRLIKRFPHPAYAKRFLKLDYRAYGKLLKKEL